MVSSARTTEKSPHKKIAVARQAAVVRQRWGGQQNASPEEACARIVEAAIACYARQSVAGTTMADIAAEAKVARATLYRHFASREAIMLAVFRHEGRLFLEAFRSEHGVADRRFCDLFCDYMVYTVRHAPATHLHQNMFGDSSALWVGRNFIADREGIDLAEEFLRESFRAARRVGEIRQDIDLRELIEYAMRVLMSFMLLPDVRPRSDDELKRYFEKYLINALRFGVLDR